MEVFGGNACQPVKSYYWSCILKSLQNRQNSLQGHSRSLGMAPR